MGEEHQAIPFYMHTPPVDENFRGVPIDGKNSEGSGENTLIHRNFRGVWRKMLSSTYRNFRGVWRKMFSST